MERQYQHLREVWIDYVKVIACVLVVLGHLLQSFSSAELIARNAVYRWFEASIYCYHVPLFFICSGYLYQKHTRLDSWKSYGCHVLKKAVVLGVPYFTFSVLTWALKFFFADSVNSALKGSLTEALFLSPLSPYWYLYVLFFLFLFVPTASKKATIPILFVLSIVGKVAVVAGAETPVYFVNGILKNAIWFVLGMGLAYAQINLKGMKKVWFATAGFCLFIGGSIIATYYQAENHQAIAFPLGIVACISVLILVINFEDLLTRSKVFPWLARYTLPIFLMHTLAAAPIRVLLVKIGVHSAPVHIIVGMLASFLLPIFAAFVMKKLKYPEFLLYPNKFIRFPTIRREVQNEDTVHQ